MDREAHLSGRTGQLETFIAHNPIAEIYSDFNHTGEIEKPDERAHRDTRPGGILLPFLDPAPSHTGYLTPVHICQSEWSKQQPSRSDEVFQFDLEFVNYYDRRRVNVWKQETGALVLGGQKSSILIQVPNGGADVRYRIGATTLAGDPRAPGPFNSDPPPAGSPHQTIRPGEVWLRLRALSTRLEMLDRVRYMERDMEMTWDAMKARLEGRPPKRCRTEPPKEPPKDAPKDDDFALFQIAPLLLQSNLEPADRLYVVSDRNTHSFVYDVMEACWAAFGPEEPFDRDFSREFRASTPDSIDEDDTVQSGACLLRAGAMYLIDGRNYQEGDDIDHSSDNWIQDQMAIGYCSAPGDRSINVVVHCSREAPLHDFVRNEMNDRTNKEDGVFVFDGLSQSEGVGGSSGDFGGNIAVSPPVMERTGAENTRKAGPPVPEHPPAPHGKIVLGDCYNPHRPFYDTVHPDTRTFLRAQEIQPIIPIDTSWLAVGHVDEIMTFVPDPSQNGSAAKLAMARPDIMEKLLTRTRQIPMEQGRTHFHRGRYADFYCFPDSIDEYDETSIETLCQEGTAQHASNRIQKRFLKHIEKRLCHCTGLTSPDDVLPLPVYFDYAADDDVANPKEADWGKVRAEIRTPNVVNMQVLTTGPEEAHLLLPRPCGPRLPPDDAEGIVQDVLNEIGRGDTPVCRLPDDENDNPSGFPFWAWPGLNVDTLALFFAREKPGQELVTAEERKRMIKDIESDDGLEAEDLEYAVEKVRRAIFEENPEAKKHLDDNGTFKNWYRLFIPEDTVDVLELYTRSVLKGIGCRVHFVDAWFYHTSGGGAHCGTNVLHEPPTAESLKRTGRSPWWEHYPTLSDEDLNATYDPGDTLHDSEMTDAESS